MALLSPNGKLGKIRKKILDSINSVTCSQASSPFIEDNHFSLQIVEISSFQRAFEVPGPVLFVRKVKEEEIVTKMHEDLKDNQIIKNAACSLFTKSHEDFTNFIPYFRGKYSFV